MLCSHKTDAMFDHNNNKNHQVPHILRTYLATDKQCYSSTSEIKYAPDVKTLAEKNNVGS